MPAVALAPRLTLALSPPHGANRLGTKCDFSDVGIRPSLRTRTQGFLIRLKASGTNKERVMDSDRAAGMWKEMKGKVKQQWGKLTDDDLEQLEGHSEQLAGKLQERYGLAKEEAERQAKEFRSRNNWN